MSNRGRKKGKTSKRKDKTSKGIMRREYDTGSQRSMPRITREVVNSPSPSPSPEPRPRKRRNVVADSGDDHDRWSARSEYIVEPETQPTPVPQYEEETPVPQYEEETPVPQYEEEIPEPSEDSNSEPEIFFTLLIRNVASEATATDLLNSVFYDDDVVDIKMGYDRQGRKFAEVSFDDDRSRRRALKMCKGIELFGIPLRITAVTTASGFLRDTSEIVTRRPVPKKQKPKPTPAREFVSSRKQSSRQRNPVSKAVSTKPSKVANLSRAVSDPEAAATARKARFVDTQVSRRVSPEKERLRGRKRTSPELERPVTTVRVGSRSPTKKVRIQKPEKTKPKVTVSKKSSVERNTTAARSSHHNGRNTTNSKYSEHDDRGATASRSSHHGADFSVTFPKARNLSGKSKRRGK